MLWRTIAVKRGIDGSQFWASTEQESPSHASAEAQIRFELTGRERRMLTTNGTIGFRNLVIYLRRV